MKDDSFLIFETGNGGEINQKYFKYFQRFQYPDHLFFFSTENLIDLLEKTGFDFIKIYRYSILPQLVVIKALSWIINSIKRYVLKSNEKEKHLFEGSSVVTKPTTDSQSLDFNYFIKKSVKKLLQYFNYVLRYKVGRIAPKVYRPQTVIVIAKKRR